MMPSVIDLLAAAAPLVLALGLLALGRVVWAAPSALVLALVLVPIAFPLPVGDLLGAVRGGVPTVIEVAGLLWAGILLARVLEAVGAQSAMAQFLARYGVTPTRTVLLVVLGLAPFAEAVTGFGVGAVIALPVLLGLGLSPLRAASIALLGLNLVPWGAMAVGTLVAADLGGVPVDDLGLVSVAWNVPVSLTAAIVAVILAHGRAPRGRDWVEILLTTGLQHGLLLGASASVGTVPAAAVACLLLLTVLVLRARVLDGVVGGPGAVLRPALLAGVVLLVGLVLSRVLIGRTGAPGEALSVAERVISSPVTWMLVAAAVIWWVRPWGAAGAVLARPSGRRVAASAWALWVPVTITTVGFLLLGVVMAGTGMSTALAEAAVQALGVGYLVVGPLLSGLGGFLTGSNAGSASMFAASAAEAADGLRIDPLQVLAVQSVTASALAAASPARVALVIGMLAASRSSGSADDAEHLARAVPTSRAVTRRVLTGAGTASLVVAVVGLAVLG